MKETIKVVHAEELDEFFTRIGCGNAFRAGQLKCSSCKQTITAENFRAVTRSAGRLVFFCSDEKCLHHEPSKGNEDERLPG